MTTRPSGRIAEEQAALRRVAVLVARGTPPEETFTAVTREVGRVLGTELTALARYDPGGAMTYVARLGTTTDDVGVGLCTPLGGRNLSTLVAETGRPARMDDYSQLSGPAGDVVRRSGIRSGVGVPVSVEGRLWGVMLAGSTSEEPLPADTEARLAGFTELVGIAIAGAQARAELRGYAEEQAALRRVATLVAGGTPPEGVFGAVAGEAGRLLGADLTGVARYDTAGMATSVGLWTKTGTSRGATVGDQLRLGGRNATTMVFQTGQPARIDDYASVSGECGDAGRSMGFGSAAGVPVRAAGRLWGVIVAGSAYPARLPADTEARLAGFTELVATAIANAEAQAALATSRARIITAGDEARRRMERDLHDGAQQRLVTLGLRLRELQAAASPGDCELARGLDEAAAGLKAALEELREIARGIHPAVLADGGLYLALKALTRRSTVPVTLRVQIPGRLPAPVEIAAYYVVSETLTNVARHADARTADVEVVADEDALRVRVRDDGHGGATLGHGSGLVGLMDRVEAFNGQLTLHSPPGKGTTLEAHIPVQKVTRPRPMATRIDCGDGRLVQADD